MNYENYFIESASRILSRKLKGFIPPTKLLPSDLLKLNEIINRYTFKHVETGIVQAPNRLIRLNEDTDHSTTRGNKERDMPLLDAKTLVQSAMFMINQSQFAMKGFTKHCYVAFNVSIKDQLGLKSGCVVVAKKNDETESKYITGWWVPSVREDMIVDDQFQDFLKEVVICFSMKK